MSVSVSQSRRPYTRIYSFVDGTGGASPSSPSSPLIRNQLSPTPLASPHPMGQVEPLLLSSPSTPPSLIFNSPSASLQLPRHSYSTHPQLRFNSPVTHIQLTLSFASTHPPLTHSITRSIADSMSITVVSPTLPYYFSTS